VHEAQAPEATSEPRALEALSDAPAPEDDWEWIVAPQELDAEPPEAEPKEEAPGPRKGDRDGQPGHWMTLRIVSASGPVTLDAPALGVLLDALESTELDSDDSSVDARLARAERTAVAARIREHAESLVQYQPDEVDRRVLGWVIDTVQHESGAMPSSVLDLGGALTR
jgi:hypothetical protein